MVEYADKIPKISAESLVKFPISKISHFDAATEEPEKIEAN